MPGLSAGEARCHLIGKAQHPTWHWKRSQVFKGILSWSKLILPDVHIVCLSVRDTHSYRVYGSVSVSMSLRVNFICTSSFVYWLRQTNVFFSFVLSVVSCLQNIWLQTKKCIYCYFVSTFSLVRPEVHIRLTINNLISVQKVRRHASEHTHVEHTVTQQVGAGIELHAVSDASDMKIWNFSERRILSLVKGRQATLGVGWRSPRSTTILGASSTPLYETRLLFFNTCLLFSWTWTQ